MNTINYDVSKQLEISLEENKKPKSIIEDKKLKSTVDLSSKPFYFDLTSKLFMSIIVIVVASSLVGIKNTFYLNWIFKIPRNITTFIIQEPIIIAPEKRIAVIINVLSSVHFSIPMVKIDLSVK